MTNLLHYPHIVKPEKLNSIWKNWLTERNLNHSDRIYLMRVGFENLDSRNPTKQKFDDWMFNQGGTIRRINRQSYITFLDPRLALAFMLKHG